MLPMSATILNRSLLDGVEVMKIRFTGDNHEACRLFCGAVLQVESIDDEGAAYTLKYPRLNTSRGVVRVELGDWIIKRGGANPRFWLIPEDFAKFFGALAC